MSFKEEVVATDYVQRKEVIVRELKELEKRLSPKNRKKPISKIDQQKFIHLNLKLKVIKLERGECMFFKTPDYVTLLNFNVAIKNACLNVFGRGVVGTSQKSGNGIFIYFK
jgi:hypothetical protein